MAVCTQLWPRKSAKFNGLHPCCYGRCLHARGKKETGKATKSMIVPQACNIPKKGRGKKGEATCRDERKKEEIEHPPDRRSMLYLRHVHMLPGQLG